MATTKQTIALVDQLLDGPAREFALRKLWIDFYGTTPNRGTTVEAAVDDYERKLVTQISDIAFDFAAGHLLDDDVRARSDSLSSRTDSFGARALTQIVLLAELSGARLLPSMKAHLQCFAFAQYVTVHPAFSALFADSTVTLSSFDSAVQNAYDDLSLNIELRPMHTDDGDTVLQITAREAIEKGAIESCNLLRLKLDLTEANPIFGGAWGLRLCERALMTCLGLPSSSLPEGATLHGDLFDWAALYNQCHHVFDTMKVPELMLAH